MDGLRTAVEALACARLTGGDRGLTDLARGRQFGRVSNRKMASLAHDEAFAMLHRARATASHGGDAASRPGDDAAGTDALLHRRLARLQEQVDQLKAENATLHEEMARCLKENEALRTELAEKRLTKRSSKRHEEGQCSGSQGTSSADARRHPIGAESTSIGLSSTLIGRRRRQRLTTDRLRSELHNGLGDADGKSFSTASSRMKQYESTGRRHEPPSLTQHLQVAREASIACLHQLPAQHSSVHGPREMACEQLTRVQPHNAMGASTTWHLHSSDSMILDYNEALDPLSCSTSQTAFGSVQWRSAHVQHLADAEEAADGALAAELAECMPQHVWVAAHVAARTRLGSATAGPASATVTDSTPLAGVPFLASSEVDDTLAARAALLEASEAVTSASELWEDGAWSGYL